MKTLFFILFLAGFLFPLYKVVGQSFPVSQIPDSLKASAHAVIRLSERSFEVQGKTSAKLTIREAVTILDDSGKENDELLVYYSKSIVVKNYKAYIYDASGQLVKTIKSSDFKDLSAVSGFSLYEDTRMIYYRPVVAMLPYTVLYEAECHYNGFINFPQWMPLNEYGVSLQNASCRITVPAGFTFHYKACNLSDPAIEPYGNYIIYTWKISGMKALENEIFSPSPVEFLPILTAAPDEFVYEDHSGRLDTWEHFGLWSSQLLEGRDELAEETTAKLQQMVAGKDDPVEKIRIIYDYLQSTTRYVSIQLGIGGFQPFMASEVDQTGYGDCKALSNYTKAMLKAVGINAFYAQINAGSNARDLWLDFPSQQFNHVIVCVPIGQDTIWLECTNNTKPFGYLGDFTDNRHALLITDKGGVIVKTPAYELTDNTQIRHAVIYLNETGACNAVMKTSYSGLQYDNVSDLLNKSLEDQRDHYYESIPFSNMKINLLELTHTDMPIPTAFEQLDLTIPAYGSASGKRLFLPLNPFNQLTFLFKAGKQRKNDILVRRSFWDTDTIEFVLPTGFLPEHMPESIQLSTPFGEYSASVSSENGQIRYIREYKLFRGRYPASAYPEMEDFLKKIILADHQKAVLVKQY